MPLVGAGCARVDDIADYTLCVEFDDELSVDQRFGARPAGVNSAVRPARSHMD